MKDKEKYIVRSAGNIVSLNMFIFDLNQIREEQWRFEVWKAKDALVDKSGNKQLFTGQNYNSADFTVKKEGWNHDHCEMCVEMINKDSADGYTDGYLWLCQDCYKRYILPDSIDDIISEYEIIEK